MQPVMQFDIAEFRRFAARFDLGIAKGWLADLLDRPNSRDFAMPGYEALLAQRVRALIEAGRPASCLRLGDGEGNILGADDGAFRNLQRLAAQKAAEMHLGKWFPAAVLRRWRQAMLDAIANADVIGVPCEARIDRLYRSLKSLTSDRHFDIRGACGTINALRFGHTVLSNAPAGPSVTDCWFHRDLLPYYGDILKDIDRVGLIGCYPELPQKLRSSFAIGSVDYFPIPNQISNTGLKPRRRHYPDCFDQVVESLNLLQKGQLVLVAAGLLGKIYCDRIKRAGAIALDIGSVADVWMGKRSRWYHDDAYLQRWKLS